VGYVKHLYNSNVYSCLQCNDTELTWQIIKETLYKVMDLFIPKVKLKAKQFPKWFTPDIFHHLKCLHTLRKKYKRSPTSHNLPCLTTTETQFNFNVETAKAMYEKQSN